jgi:3-isopropylmalate/(R)-2-methylmalate dehydratase large subunit
VGEKAVTEGKTIIAKILSRAAGVDEVAPGDILVCEVNRIVQLDLPFTTKSEPLPIRITYPERVAIILDHSVPAPTVADAEGQSIARDFARRMGITEFVDVGDHGICHQVILEKGFARPGEILACGDSHTCASGAMNCAARGLGRLEMLQVMCTGRTWYRLEPTALYELDGRLPAGVFGKDVFLAIAGMYGEHTNLNVEFAGSGVSSLSIDNRATIATMFAEVSAEFSIFPFDDVTEAHLRAAGVDQSAYEPVAADPDAAYADVRKVALNEVVPMVALPEFVPHNTMPVNSMETRRVDQCFIGSCANGKLSDLAEAAAILKGRRVAPGVRLIVTPASQRVYLEAVRRGYVETLVEAGAVVTNSTCGACWGGSMGVLAPGETCITSSTRNFKGRMGSPEANIYLASSSTVAASAVVGHIVDPRELAVTS